LHRTTYPRIPTFFGRSFATIGCKSAISVNSPAPGLRGGRCAGNSTNWRSCDRCLMTLSDFGTCRADSFRPGLLLSVEVACHEFLRKRGLLYKLTNRARDTGFCTRPLLRRAVRDRLCQGRADHAALNAGPTTLFHKPDELRGIDGLKSCRFTCCLTMLAFERPVPASPRTPAGDD
jgi:hypothetical protein